MRRGGGRTVGLDLGLDAGGGCARVAVVDHSGPEPRVAALAEAAPASDPERVAEGVAQVFGRESIGSVDVVLAVSGPDVVGKRIEMERVSESDLPNVLPWEAEQHVPFDMERVELDFAVTDPGGPSSPMSVFLAAARRDLIDERLGLARAAGLRPLAIDLEACALRNALERSHPEALRGVTALAVSGERGAALHVLSGGLPILSREIEFGSEPGAAIARGIERVAALLEDQDAGLGIARIRLCGALATAPGLVQSVARRIGLETRLANPLARLGAAARVADRPDLDEVAPAFMLAVGLALRPPDRRGR